MRRRGLVAGVLAAGLAVSLTSPTAAWPGATRPGERAQAVSVTLLTGDRVILTDGDPKRAVIDPAVGNPGRRFHRSFVDGQLHVIPSDVYPQVAAGVLDRRLFDVTGLIEAGYDDKHTGKIPLIVSYRADYRGTAKRPLRAINGSAIEVPKPQAATFTVPAGAERVWLDGRRELALDESVPMIGAPTAWAAGFTGQGVTVAVLDSGVDAGHPDLAGQVVRAQDFTGTGPGDQDGHGTHLASIIAGTGAASAGRYRGVAPGAKVMDAKVCTGDGCAESAVLAGMEWAAVEQGADVLNLSLGGADTPELDPVEAAVDNLTARTGALFVVAAGNHGPAARSVSSPGSADAALTVGAVDKSDELARTSSRGPRVGDGAIKPDLTAPGIDITAARAEGTSPGQPVDEHHTSWSGTSMATPHVAGAAALLAQQHPDWRAGELKSALVGSAEPDAELTAFEQGAGRVDVRSAIGQTVLAEPASLSFGTAVWPHGDDEPVARQLTYRNTGDEAVALTLDATMTGPGGEPAPDGALTLSASTLTVPAGGTASVTVTSDTAHGGPDGVYSGRITATYAGGSVGTPAAVDKEPESYTLTIESLDRSGAPTPVFANIHGWDTDVLERPFAEDGTVEVRLPKGAYIVETNVFGGDGSTSFLVQPRLVLDHDLTLSSDARQARPVSQAVEHPDARPVAVELSYQTDRRVAAGLFAEGFDGLYAAHLGPAEPVAGFTAGLATGWRGPVGYELLDWRTGVFWNGYRKAVRDRNLARLDQRFDAETAGRAASTTLLGYAPDAWWPSVDVVDLTLPAALTVYVSTGGASWEQAFSDDITQLGSPARGYRAGRRYAERWNAPVFSPTPVVAERDGDRLSFDAAMYSDRAGHAGSSPTDTASTVLYRDGRKVAESDSAGQVEAGGLAPERAELTVETTAERPAYSRFSTRQTARWTFRSGAGDSVLPTWTVRLATGTGLVPMRLVSTPGAGELVDVNVKLSTDDGRSWRKAPVVPAGADRYLVPVEPPTGAEYVSFQVSARDDRGSSVEQTIIRAYALD